MPKKIGGAKKNATGHQIVVEHQVPNMEIGHNAPPDVQPPLRFPGSHDVSEINRSRERSKTAPKLDSLPRTELPPKPSGETGTYLKVSGGKIETVDLAKSEKRDRLDHVFEGMGEAVRNANKEDVTKIYDHAKAALKSQDGTVGKWIWNSIRDLFSPAYREHRQNVDVSYAKLEKAVYDRLRNHEKLTEPQKEIVSEIAEKYESFYVSRWRRAGKSNRKIINKDPLWKMDIAHFERLNQLEKNLKNKLPGHFDFNMVEVAQLSDKQLSRLESALHKIDSNFKNLSKKTQDEKITKTQNLVNAWSDMKPVDQNSLDSDANNALKNKEFSTNFPTKTDALLFWLMRSNLLDRQ